MKPSKLKQHLETKHHSLKKQNKKKTTCWILQKTASRPSKKVSYLFIAKQEQALHASYHVAHGAEELIFPAAMDVVDIDPQLINLKTIPLSNDTMCRRIEDVSEDKQQTTAPVKASGHFALQNGRIYRHYKAALLCFCETWGTETFCVHLKHFE